MKKPRGRSVRRSGPSHRTGRESVRALHEAGARLIEKGRYEEALGRFRRVARRGRPDDPRLLFNIGFALARLGRNFAAARAYRRCLEITPRDADAWFNLGNAYREVGALRRAARAYAAAASLETSDHEVWNNLGNVRAALGENAAAAEAYRSALAIRPGYHPGWNNLGNALHALGDHQGAIACYDRAIDLQGASDQLYYFNRALALLSAGRADEAVRDIGRWATISPFQDTDARAVRSPDWLKFLQSLAPSRPRKEIG